MIISNEIDVAGTDHVENLIEKRIVGHPHYSALKKISWKLKDGVLILQGCLPTFYLKQIAQEVVGGIEGIERIDNQIQVINHDPEKRN